MMSYQMKSQTEQLNLRPSVVLIKRLERLAETLRGDVKKKNEIAVDILESYIDHWEQAERLKKDVIKRQFELIAGDAANAAAVAATALAAGITPDEQPYEEIEDRGALDDEKRIPHKKAG